MKREERKEENKQLKIWTKPELKALDKGETNGGQYAANYTEGHYYFGSE